MNRLIVCPQTSGGICHYTYGLADGLAGLGERCTVLTTSSPPYELRAIAHRHRVISALRWQGAGPARALQPIRNLAALLKCLPGVEAVHFQWPLGPRTDLLLWRACRKLGRRVVYTAHNVAPHEAGNPAEGHTGWLYANADAIIVHGRTLAQQLVAQQPAAEDRVHVMPHGNYLFIADRFGSWNRADARRSFGWSEEEKVILFFGLIRRYKALDILIEACGRLVAKGGPGASRTRLLVAGESVGGEWDTGCYRERLEDAGISGITTLALGYVPLEEMGRYFHAADAVALPYRGGSQSGLLQVAYAFQKPVVATEVSSIGEAIMDGVTGLIVPPESPACLAAALGRLLGCGDEARAMGRAGRAYAESAFSWERIACATREIYRG